MGPQLSPKINAGMSIVKLWAVASLLACNSADLIQAPAAPDQGACPKVPIVACDAMAPAPGSCVGDPSSDDPGVQKLPTDAGFPTGCTAKVLSGANANDCVVAETCECTPNSADAGDAGSHWVCSK